MNGERNIGHQYNSPFFHKISFWIITLIHDNPLLPLIQNPYNLLKSCGLGSGQTVVEVGCGPGFYTIPAARIIGDRGVLFAIDLNPYAIERIRIRKEKEGLINVRPVLANASNTGLEDQSVDMAFLFGLPHIVGGLETLILEMDRILKTDGILLYKKAGRPKENLFIVFEKIGFVMSDRKRRVLVFKKDIGNKRAQRY